jgi:hypothetical protein
MRKIVWVFLLLPFCCFCYAQNHKLDSLNRLIANASSDTQRINLAVKKIRILSNNNLDSSINFGNQTIDKLKSYNISWGKQMQG